MSKKKRGTLTYTPPNPLADRPLVKFLTEAYTHSVLAGAPQGIPEEFFNAFKTCLNEALNDPKLKKLNIKSSSFGDDFKAALHTAFIDAVGKEAAQAVEQGQGSSEFITQVGIHFQNVKNAEIAINKLIDAFATNVLQKYMPRVQQKQ